MRDVQTLCGSPGCTLSTPGSTIDSDNLDHNFSIITSLLWIRSSESSEVTGYDDSEAVIVTAGSLDQIACPAKPALEARIPADQPDIGLLPLHQDRLMAAVYALGWNKSSEFKRIKDVITRLREEIELHMGSLPPAPPTTLEIRKVRILISKAGSLQIDSTNIGQRTSVRQNDQLETPTPTLFIPASFDDPNESHAELCKVWLDTQPTQPSMLTTHKTTHRCMYSDARDRVGLTPQTPLTAQEVLLYNIRGEITETSACTIYLKRDGVWLTPTSGCGPNLGVTRRLALEKGLCVESSIKLLELRPAEHVWLSNAVRGFFRGVVQPDIRLSGSND